MQMALPVTLPDDETFTSYFGGEDSLEVSHLKDSFSKLSQSFQYTYLCGLGDSGKSHLLYATCIQAQERGLSNMLLSMREVIDFGPMVLEGLEALDVLCIDDVHLVAGDDAWEKALFNFFNRFNEPKKMLVVTADLLPDMLNISLPDECARFLLTRLSRDMRTLLDVLDKLDHASMAAQRKLTIPFIKSTLKL